MPSEIAMTRTGNIVAAEFVWPGDNHREKQDDPPRPAGVYITIRLDDDAAVVAGGKVTVEWK